MDWTRAVEKNEGTDGDGDVAAGALRRRIWGRNCVGILAVLVVAVPLFACDREPGNPLPKAPPKPRIENR